MDYDLVKYKDIWFRTIVCLLAAHFLVMVGEKVDTLEALTIPSYYPTLLINYVISLLIALAVKKVTILLDRKCPWEVDLLRRIVLQFIFGVVMVSLLSFFLVFIYFISFNQDILESTYPAYEFPFSVVLILCLNFFYMTYYFYLQRKHSSNIEKEAVRPQLYQVQPEGTSIDGKLPSVTKKEKKEILIIETPSQSIPIKISCLAFAFVHNGATLVFLKNMVSKQEAYITYTPLKELEDELEQEQFYRINRKCLVSFECVKAFKPGPERTLRLILEPDMASWTGMEKQELTKLVTVSADRVIAFKRWIDR